MPTRDPRPHPAPAPRHPARLDDASPDTDAEFAAWLGERLRRLALGLTAALVVARAYWESEPDFRADAGRGMVWVAALLAVFGLALASSLVAGTLRLRRSWADAGVIALTGLVALSAGHALDRRPAINLAWEWGGIGLTYLLLRNLPRTRGESRALAGVFIATAVALSVYGFYQVGVELPAVQARYLAHREEQLRMAGIPLGSPAQALYESRLLGSNEVFSTFALANSLAGFVLAPLVLMLASAWNALTRRPASGEAPPLAAVLSAAVPTLAVLVCLILTKSRSASLGLLAAGVVLALRERRRVAPRTLALAVLGAAVVVSGLVAAGLMTGRLDKEVFTQSGKSLGYRWHYWQGAWRVLTSSSRAFWYGLGPGNFVAPYVQLKAPEAGEEIADPHNFVLEVATTAGVWAVVALALALGSALWALLGPGPASAGAGEGVSEDRLGERAGAPASPAWVVLWGGLGGWLGVVLLGRLNPFQNDLFERWLILGAAWGLAVALGMGLARRPGVLTAPAFGAAVVALLVNLTAAGGIGVPGVALMLWGSVALGLNLREDRPCARLRNSGGRVTAFALAAAWTALLGTFIGAVGPYFRVEAAFARAEEALAARPPAIERAEAAYSAAAEADAFSARPWLVLAALDYQAWVNRGAKADDLRWRKVPIELLKAVQSPRTTNSWSRHRERARMMSLLLRQLGGGLTPLETTRFRGNVVEASRTAVRLYPTNASLRAWLAEASADIGMIPDALKEGREALRLDALTPHADKKLDPNVRLWLDSHIPDWEKAAANPPAPPAPKANPGPRPNPRP